MLPWIRDNTRTVLVAFVATASVAPTAVAQRGAQLNERVLFLVPRPVDPADSQYVVQLSDYVRQRMDNRLRHRIFVIPTQQYCELLTQSGFPCGAFLSPVDAARTARALQSDAYIHGTFEHVGPVPTLQYRLVDIGNSGLSGWQTARGTAGDQPRQFANTIVDSIGNQVRAAEKVRECLDRRDRGDYNGAIGRAQEALQIYANHPSAAICAAVSYEARRVAPDSQIMFYEIAVKGDSVNERALERLQRLHLARGDSAASIGISRRLLEINPDDRDRRRGIVAGLMIIGDFDGARDVAGEWLEQHPTDMDFLQLKARACTQGGMWNCALEALTAQYERDSSLVGDTIFYGTIVGAAQESGDHEAVARWSREAIEHSDHKIPWLRAHVGAIEAMGMTDSAMAIYEGMVARDPSDVGASLTYAKLIIESLTIDTVTPIDTASLLKAEQLLDNAVRRSPADTAVRMNAAVNYYTPGAALAQAQRMPRVAIRLLEKAVGNDVLQRIQVNANFFLGFTLLFEAFAMDPRVVAGQTCALVNEEADLVRRGLAAMQKGRELAPANADQFIARFQDLTNNRIPELRRAFCQ